MLVTLLGMVMLVRPVQSRMRNPDAGDAVGDGDARQASAVIECAIRDDCNWLAATSDGRDRSPPALLPSIDA